MHEEFITLVNKAPDLRSEFECSDMVPWIQNHSPLLETVPEGKYIFPFNNDDDHDDVYDDDYYYYYYYYYDDITKYKNKTFII